MLSPYDRPLPHAKNMGIGHMERLLDCVMSYVGPDIRAKLMREVPAAYNAYCGREIVRVVRVEDGSEVAE